MLVINFILAKGGSLTFISLLSCAQRGSGKKKDTQLSSTRNYLRDEYVRQHLIAVDFSTLVARPDAVESNEWLAMHGRMSTLHFFCL